MKFVRRFLVPRWWVTLRCLQKFGAKVSPRAEVELTRNLKLGKGVQIASYVKVKSTGPLTIGNDVHIAAGCTISAFVGGITIGDDTLIGPNVVIVSNMYKYDKLDVPLNRQGRTSRGVTIGKCAFLGAGVVVTDGSVIGDNVIVAPNSVVSGTIQDNVIVSGNPAKVIFERR